MPPYTPTMLEPHAPPFLQTQPHVIVRGERLTVWDSAGQAYLDATSGMFCTTLGYSQPRLVKAAADQMARLPFYASFAHRTNDVVLDLADQLAAVAPMSMGRTLFANSGAEAVDSAIKLAWYYHRCVGRTGRAKVISHRQGYHGTTVAAGSATGLDYIHLGFEMPLPQFVKIARHVVLVRGPSRSRPDAKRAARRGREPGVGDLAGPQQWPTCRRASPDAPRLPCHRRAPLPAVG